MSWRWSASASAFSRTKKEYDFIHKRGYVLQLDAPDLGFDRNNAFSNLSTKEFQREMELNIEAINVAIADIPPQKVKMPCLLGELRRAT